MARGLPRGAARGAAGFITSRAELDFVVSSGTTLVGVESKAAEIGRPRLTRSARSFVEACAPTALLVVDRGFEASQDRGKTAVRWIRPHRLASSLVALLR